MTSLTKGQLDALRILANRGEGRYSDFTLSDLLDTLADREERIRQLEAVLEKAAKPLNTLAMALDQFGNELEISPLLQADIIVAQAEIIEIRRVGT